MTEQAPSAPCPPTTPQKDYLGEMREIIRDGDSRGRGADHPTTILTRQLMEKAVNEIEHLRRHTQEGGESVLAPSGRVVPLQSPSDAWRTIETAPKDGRRIDVSYRGGTRMTDAFWKDGAWWFGTHDDDCFSTNGPAQPTHWMPIPAPPNAEGSAAESKLASTERPDRHPSPTRAEMVEALRDRIERLERDIMELTCGDPGLVSEATKTDRIRTIANEMFRQAGYSAPMTAWQQEEYEDRARALLRAILTKADSETSTSLK